MNRRLLTPAFWQQWRALSLLPLALLSGFLFFAQTGRCEIHRYIDEHGTSVFVDDAYLSPSERQDLQQRVQASELAVRRSRKTPVEIQGNQVLVPVELSDGHNRIRARLLLDTGASQTVFHRRTMKPLQTRLLGKGWSRLAGGQRIATDKVRLESLRVGPHTWQNPTVYVIDLQDPEVPFDGLLGMDFLRDHHYRVDFNQQLLIWQPAD